MKVIRPTSPERFNKAAGEADPKAVFDTTLNVTVMMAVNEPQFAHDRDQASILVMKEVVRRLRQAMPTVEIATYPDPSRKNDPDYPESTFVPIFESIRDADIFLLGTSTTTEGTCAAAQEFFEHLYQMLRKFDSRGMRITADPKLAACTVIGGCGAFELASEIGSRLSSMGYILPSCFSVVYDDGSSERTKGTAPVMDSRSVQEQIDAQVAGILRLAKLLKFQE